MSTKYKVDISIGIIIKTILILLAIWVIYLIADILAILFVSFLFVCLFEPFVDWMQNKKIPRALGVTIVYVFMLMIISVFIGLIIPPIISQGKDFIKQWPTYSQNINNFIFGIQSFFEGQHININVQEVIIDLGKKLPNLSGGIFSTTIGIFSGIFTAIMILALAFYMSVRKDGIKNLINLIIPEKHREYAANLIDRTKIKMSHWVQGQLVLMLIVFILDFVGLTLIGIPFALILAIIAGILEIVPFIGPIISAIPAVLIGFTISPFAGIAALVLYIVVQQLENNIIVPQIMKKAVGLNPIAVIVVLLIGAELGGVVGAILSIPLATAANVYLEDVLKDKE